MGHVDQSDGLDFVPVIDFVHNLQELHIEVRSQASSFALSLESSGTSGGLASNSLNLFVNLA